MVQHRPILSHEAMESVRHLRWEMADLIWLIDRLMAEASRIDQLQTALHCWIFVSLTMESLLVTCNERLEADRDRMEREFNGAGRRPEPEPGRMIVCRICRENLPTIMFRSCGHVVCPDCSRRLFRCPICRQPIVGRSFMYF